MAIRSGSLPRTKRRDLPLAAADTGSSSSAPAAGTRLAQVERIDADGRLWLCGDTAPARLLAGMVPQAGDTVLVAAGLPGTPVVLGIVRDRLPATALVDGERLELSAAREITLRCGEASLTLTRAGKVVLAGTAVLSRAQGVNRIIGGSVQIN